MTFGSPAWLLGLLAVPAVLAAYRASRRRAKRYAVRFTAMPSLRLAAGTVPAWRRHLPAALALAALAALVISLAKPQETVAVTVQRASIMLVTDHSGSMNATDVKPDRLTAAQDAARNFLNRLPGGIRVGVVAFSDTPDAVQAPSADHDAARRIIDSEIADGATDTGDALQVAIDALRHDRQNGRRPPSAIVLISDGKTTTGSDPVTVANLAGKLHIPIHTVALGNLDTTIPNPDPFGPPIPVPPDPATLRRISQASGGRAFTAEDADRLNSIYRTLGSQLGIKRQPKEITASFAIGALALLLGAGAASLRWSARLP